MILRIIAALTLASMTLAQGSELSFNQTPVRIGPAPLLVFASRVKADDMFGAYSFHITNLEGKGKAEEFLRYRGNMRLVRRLDTQHVLISLHKDGYGLYVFDLAAGTSRKISRNTRACVGVHGHEILYRGSQTKGPLSRTGPLLAISWLEAGKPRVLADTPLGDVHIDGDVAIGYESATGAVHCIDLIRGGSRELTTLPVAQEGQLFDFNFAISPDRRRFAIGHTGNPPQGTIRIHDLPSGELEQEWKNISIDIPGISSSMPTMEIDWAGPDQLTYSESRGNRRLSPIFYAVTRDVITGEVDRAVSYGQHLRHRLPDESLPDASRFHTWDLLRGMAGKNNVVCFGLFERKGDALFFTDGTVAIAAGDKALVVRGRLKGSPDGRYALVLWNKGVPVLDVIDGKKHVHRRVFDGIATEVFWLPAK